MPGRRCCNSLSAKRFRQAKFAAELFPNARPSAPWQRKSSEKRPIDSLPVMMPTTPLHSQTDIRRQATRYGDSKLSTARRQTTINKGFAMT